MLSSSPATSPLANYGTKSNQHLSVSSPLSGSSPTSAAQLRRKSGYKSQTSSRSAVVAPSLSGGTEDTPQKRFLRDRLKVRCLERMQNRARAVTKRRASNSGEGSSSDVFEIDEDCVLEEEEKNLDDELYWRVMMDEQRRAKYSKMVSFERDFGSSIDPDMYEDIDALEWELTGKTSTGTYSSAWEDLDVATVREYLAELEDLKWSESPHQELQFPPFPRTAAYIEEDPRGVEHKFTREIYSPPQLASTSMHTDFHMSSPPPSPANLSTSQQDSINTQNCPFCSTPIARTRIACSRCITQYPLELAHAAWNDPAKHPEGQQMAHVPLATRDLPNCSGIVLLCGASGCDWCFAL